MTDFARTILAICVLTLGLIAPAHAGLPPQRVVIGLDLSQSNILIMDDAFARKAAERVRLMLQALPPRSMVSLRTFGNYDFRSNSVSRDWEVGLKTTRPEFIAAVVAQIIATVPAEVRAGHFQSQNTTNIVGFLENTGYVTQCSVMPATVILVTDGVEDSALTDLSRRNRTLPARPGLFNGCNALVMLGIGQRLRNPAKTDMLRQQWGEWARIAGFRSFQGLNDW